MHLQNFKVQEHTIKEFTKMCERLESALIDSPSTKRTNKGLSHKNEFRGNQKHCHHNINNKNDGEKKLYCLLHGNNPTHNTNDCQTLKRQTKEQKKARNGNCNDKRNNKKKGYVPNKEEVHALVQFAKNSMKQEQGSQQL